MRKLLALAAFALAATFLHAAPDTVDLNFAGSAGQVFRPDNYGGIASMLVQPDGKILFGSNEMAGIVGVEPLSLPLIRFLPDGTVDNTFFADNEPNGSDAGIFYDGAGMSEIHSVGLLSDGKIVAAGVMQGVRTGTVSAPGTFLKSNSIVRFNPDGTIDTTFQTAGTVGWPVGGLNYIRTVVIQPNNKIVAVGGFGGFRDTESGPTSIRYGIARLNLDGSVDSGFQIMPSEFGVPVGAANVRGWFRSAALDTSGRILITGEFEWGPAYPSDGKITVVARLHPDGSLDSSFSPVLPSHITNFLEIGVEPDGKIMVIGTNSNGSVGWMARFLPDGTNDPSFTLDPSLTGPVSSRPLQPDGDGRYLLSTRSAAGSSYNRLVRIQANGTLDPSFEARASYVNGVSGAGQGYFSNMSTAPSGKIYSGSYFDRVNGEDTVKIVAFEGDNAANAPGKLQFSASTYFGTEQAGVMRVAVTRNGGVSGVASATLVLTHGTTSSADLSLSSSTVTFADGSGGMKYIEIPLVADRIAEPNETATLALTSISGATAGTRTSALLTIIDSDSAPTITRQPQTLFVPPGNSFALNVGISSGATPVTYQWFCNGTAIAGATSSRYAIAAADVATHDGSYTVAVTNPNGPTVSAVASVTVKNPAMIRFATATANVVESDGTFSLTLQRSGSAQGAVSVDVHLQDGTATAPADFLPLNTTVSWADGDSADKSIVISLVNDTEIEAAETFQAVLTNPSLDVMVASPSIVNITLLDDDSGPAILSPLASLRAVTGWNASLSVVVQSQTAVTYQWLKDEAPVSGATSATLTFSPVTLADYGYYSVEITNTAGTVTSGPVELGARPNPLDRIVPDLSISSNQFSGMRARINGGYLVFGAFTSLPTSSGSIAAQRIARTGPDGKVDMTFLPPVGSTVTHAMEVPDGSVLVAGGFTTIGVIAVPGGFAKLLPDGTVDSNFLAQLPAGIGGIRDIEMGPDGRIYLTHANGVDRLQIDGTYDAAFRANVLSGFQSGGTYNNLGFAPGGGFYLAGNLNIVNGISGQTLRRFVRLNPNGTNDPTWKYTGAGAMTNFGVQKDGKPILAGSTLIRLNLDGSTDTTFTAIVGVYNQLFAVAADDSIYIASGSGASTKLRHFLPNGLLDTAFNNGVDPSFNNNIYSIDALADGTISIHGGFATFNGVSVSRPLLITGELQNIQITGQPVAQVVDPSSDTTLRVVAASVSALTYQWRKNDVIIPGANRPSLTFTNVNSADTGSYSVTVTSATRSVVSAPAMFTVRDRPQIVATPSDSTYLEGQPLELEIDWVGLAPATFEWFRNGTSVPGQTTNILSLPSPTGSHSGVYTLQITNSLGTVTTIPIVVQIVKSPGALASGFIVPTGGSPSINTILPEDGGAHLMVSAYNYVVHPSGTYRTLERVDANGNIRSPFLATINTNVQRIGTDPASGDLILIGNNFVLNGVGNRRVARISAVGLESTSYSANADLALIAQNVQPNYAAFDTSGRLLVGAYNKLIRLMPNGTHDTSFIAGTVSGTPNKIVPLPDGKSLVLFNSSLVRYLESGALDPSFTLGVQPGASNLQHLEIDSAGNILLPDPQNAKQAIYRISSSGTLLATIDFPRATFGGINAFLLLKSGNMLVAHQNGKRLTRLLPNGDVDAFFDIGTGFNSNVSSLGQGPDGSVWAGGSFTQFRGANAYGLVRLNGDPTDVVIGTQPSALTVDTGMTAPFAVSATASGTATLSYLWRKDGVALADGGAISGTTTANLSISNAQQTDQGNYDVIAINNTTGRPAISNSAALQVLREPEILALTSEQNLEVGQALTLTVSARGAGTLGYQWYRNGQAIVGANSATYTIAHAIEDNSGAYMVETTNLYGTFPSAPIAVSVTLPAGGIKFGTGHISFGNTVSAILQLPDGRTLVGGSFPSIYANSTSYPIDELALLDGNGNLVTSFDVNPSGVISAMALMPDGGILVAGNFLQIGGLNRTRIARLNPDLTVDSTWSVGTGPNSNVTTIEPCDSGYYIGGSFSLFNGNSNHGQLCRIKADGSLDITFSKPTLGVVNRIRRDGDGLIVGGNFTVANPVAGINQIGIVRLLETGALDPSFRASMGYGVSVNDVISLPDGKWLAGGPGGGAGRFLRFLADGSTDPAWLAQANNDIRALALQRDGKIVVGGNFTTLAGQSINRLARLNPNGTIDSTFAVGAGADGVVQAIAIEALGAIHIGGAFHNYRGEARTQYARLNGTPHSLGISQPPSGLTVEPGVTATFHVSALATDTISYRWRKNGVPLANGGDISGAMTSTLTISATDESDEATYDVMVTHNGDATSIISAPANLIVLGAPEILIAPAAITTEAGLSATFRVAARGVASLSYQWFRGNTSLVDGPGIAGATTDTLVLSNLTPADNGGIKVQITNSLGTNETIAVPLLVQVLPEGRDRSVALPLSVNSTINDILLFEDGSYLIGGGFTSIGIPSGAATRRDLAKFDASGVLDTSAVQINGSGVVEAIARAADGRIYIAGGFTSINTGSGNVTRNRIARLNSDLTLDTTFNPVGTGPNNAVKAILPLPDGKVLVAGDFNNVNSTAGTAYVARLDQTGAVDTTFISQATTGIRDIASGGDGTFWVAHPNSYSGQSRVVRIDASGAIATGFAYSGSMTTDRVIPQSDGTAMLVSTSYPYLQKVESSGALVAGWPNANGFIPGGGMIAAFTYPDGRSVLGGSFTTFAGISRKGLAAIETDGSLITSFDPQDGFYGNPTRIRSDATGRLWIVGSFTKYRGETVPNMVVLNGLTPTDPFADFVAGLPANDRGATDDPDLDGLPNLIEFIFGMSPISFTPSPLSHATTTALGATISPSLDPAKRYRIVEIETPKDTRGATISLAASMDLSFTGDASATEFGTREDRGAKELRRYYLTPALEDAAQLFWRLEVTR